MKSQHKELAKSFNPRPMRIFSKELKRKLVGEIENRRLSVRDVANLYHVASQTVYRWLKKYSTTNNAGTIMVVQSESTESQVQKLLNHMSELERAVGKKQMEIDFLNKVIDICTDEIGIDFKKKYYTMQSNGTEQINQ